LVHTSVDGQLKLPLHQGVQTHTWTMKSFDTRDTPLDLKSKLR
jgi:hypothetical protein